MGSTGVYWKPIWNALEPISALCSQMRSTSKWFPAARQTRKIASGSPSFSNTVCCAAAIGERRNSKAPQTPDPPRLRWIPRACQNCPPIQSLRVRPTRLHDVPLDLQFLYERQGCGGLGAVEARSLRSRGAVGQARGGCSWAIQLWFATVAIGL